MLNIGSILYQWFDFIVELFGGNNHHFGIRISENKFIFRCSNIRIYRHMNYTYLAHAHIQKVPFGPVVADCDYFISFCKSGCQQAKTYQVGHPFILCGGEFFPYSVSLNGECIFFGILFNQQRQDVKCSEYFHGTRILRVIIDFLV